MSLFLEIDSSPLRVEAAFRGDTAALRILFGSVSVTGWCAFPEGMAVSEEVLSRVKKQGGEVVVREWTFAMRDSSGRAYRLSAALSAGCVVLRPSSSAASPRFSASSAFSCAYASDAEGRFFRLTRSAVEEGSFDSALLFYTHGRASVLMRRSGAAMEFDVADRPAELVVPRRLAAELLLPPAGIPAVSFADSVASANLRELFLGMNHFMEASADSTGEKNHGRKGKGKNRCVAAVEVEQGCATDVHAEAMAVLTSGSYEASTGFRGEFGEYFCMARRCGNNWTVAGVTYKPRVLTLFFPFLEEGVEYDTEWILDADSVLPGNIDCATPASVATTSRAMVKMASCGGFVLRLAKRN